MAVLRVIALDEVFEVVVFQWVGFKCEVSVGADVVYPEILCPRQAR
jgi:hypothetical protein